MLLAQKDQHIKVGANELGRKREVGALLPATKVVVVVAVVVITMMRMRMNECRVRCRR